MGSPRYRDEDGRFTRDSGARYEVTVWDMTDGDILEKLWEATEDEVAAAEEKWRDEPLTDVQVEETIPPRETP